VVCLAKIIHDANTVIFTFQMMLLGAKVLHELGLELHALEHVGCHNYISNLFGCFRDLL
jgi:hypothetical protein